eukprot:1155302-Pelagomonas_calceolata.AAC.4
MLQQDYARTKLIAVESCRYQVTLALLTLTCPFLPIRDTCSVMFPMVSSEDEHQRLPTSRDGKEHSIVNKNTPLDGFFVSNVDLLLVF